LEIEGGLVQSNSIDPKYPANDIHNAPTLGNIVRLLRNKHPEVNIALPPQLADNVEVRDLKLISSYKWGEMNNRALPLEEWMKLAGAYVGEELEAVRVASGDKFSWKSQSFGNPPILLYTLEPSERFLKENGQEGPVKPEIEVFNFSSYFAHRRNSKPMNDATFKIYKLEVIETTKDIVIDTIQSLHPGFGLDQHAFQFHEGADLLVVMLPPDALGLAKKVINAMLAEPAGDSSLAFPKLQFSVIGEVQKPGSYDYPQNGSDNLLEVIAKAGGYTPQGAPSKIMVRRNENGEFKVYKLDAEKMVNGPANKPFEILPGDDIIVGVRHF